MPSILPAIINTFSMPQPPTPADPASLEPQGPRVSVILVTYNQAAALRRAVEALERSAGRERMEILVADCGSSDDSARIDSAFPAVQMLRLPHHLGAARAMNIATRTAKGDLVLYLSPDAEVEPGTVAALADRLEPESNTVAVCPLLVDEQGRPVPRVYRIPGSDALAAAASGAALPQAPLDLAQDCVPVEYPSLDALMIRKVFIRGMNYFDQRYGHYWVDLDLAMQARRASKQILLYPSIRAVLHAAPDPLAGSALAAADRITGAAAFLGKYEGMGAALRFRLGAALSALGRFDLNGLAAALGGRKLDGSQAG
jgi:glycosyltransferase involved in cell wall biosynthesis